MVSKQQIKERQDRATRRSEAMQDNMTIKEFAQFYGCGWSRAYELVVHETKRRGMEPEPFGNGGQNNPKWLISKANAERLKKEKRPMGRPRVGDKGMTPTAPIAVSSD